VILGILVEDLKGEIALFSFFTGESKYGLPLNPSVFFIVGPSEVLSSGTSRIGILPEILFWGSSMSRITLSSISELGLSTDLGSASLPDDSRVLPESKSPNNSSPKATSQFSYVFKPISNS